MNGPLLLVFLKNPELGQVKTRLAAGIGDAQALAVYQRLLDLTASGCAPLVVQKEAWYAQRMPLEGEWHMPGIAARIQVGHDLGDRMEHAFNTGFTIGHSPVIIIGTDCPGLTTAILQEAIDSLDSHEAVIGPARDGGYYLLGLRTPLTDVFRNKQWSTSSVLAETMTDLDRAGRRTYVLPELIDVDTEADLHDTGFA